MPRKTHSRLVMDKERNSIKATPSIYSVDLQEKEKLTLLEGADGEST